MWNLPAWRLDILLSIETGCVTCILTTHKKTFQLSGWFSLWITSKSAKITCFLFLFYQWSNMFSNQCNQYLINYEFCVLIFFRSNFWIHFQIAMWIIMPLYKNKIALASDLVDSPRKYKYGMDYTLGGAVLVFLLIIYKK